MPVNVTVLGAGDAFASKGRFQAGYVINASRSPDFDGCGADVAGVDEAGGNCAG